MYVFHIREHIAELLHASLRAGTLGEEKTLEKADLLYAQRVKYNHMSLMNVFLRCQDVHLKRIAVLSA